MNFAVKNPAIAEKITQTNVENNIANKTVGTNPIVLYIPLKLTPKNVVAEFGFNIIHVISEPNVTIRPTDKSVPPSNINPATPNAKNTFVEKFFKIFVIALIDIKRGFEMIQKIINRIIMI